MRYLSCKKPCLLILAVLTIFLLFPAPSDGAIWTFFRFGDRDGFGFNGIDAPLLSEGASGAPWRASGPAGAFLGAEGNVVDTNGNGRIDPGEQLPDVNRGGKHFDWWWRRLG